MTNAPSFTITLIPAFEDNYIYLLQDKSHNITALVDPGDFETTNQYLTKHHLNLTHIFLTHHHADHIGGVKKLTELYRPQIFGPAFNQAQIPQITHPVKEGDQLAFGDANFTVIETPGHTLGHILFYEPLRHILFSGDTLFSMGCGRLFEGTYEQMFESLQKIKNLPHDTQIYCGHEYTLANGRFVLHLDPADIAVQDRMKKVTNLREKHQPSIPFTLAEELLTNPFLKAESIQEFQKIRQAKNNFV